MKSKNLNNGKKIIPKNLLHSTHLVRTSERI